MALTCRLDRDEENGYRPGRQLPVHVKSLHGADVHEARIRGEHGQQSVRDGCNHRKVPALVLPVGRHDGGLLRGSTGHLEVNQTQ